jgi:hypothetical protein
MPTLRSLRRTNPEIWTLVSEERRKERNAGKAFLVGLQSENMETVVRATEILRYSIWGQFHSALRNAARIKGISESFRHTLLDFCLENGDSLRTAARHDFLLLDFYRAVLPKYRGPSVTIYRGATLSERCNRTYGLSWTTNIQVARSFAERNAERTRDDGVVLRTVASRTSLICAPAQLNNRFGEDEFVVDRRKLKVVEVVERFRPQIKAAASTRY